jgi:hypothetical protein
MPPPPRGPKPATVDLFQALDREFEVVQRALVRADRDPREVHELGREMMVAVWRWSARHHRLRGPGAGRAKLAAQVASVLFPDQPGDTVT